MRRLLHPMTLVTAHTGRSWSPTTVVIRMPSRFSIRCMTSGWARFTRYRLRLPNDAQADPQPALAELRQRPAERPRGAGRAVQRFPVVVPARDLRALRAAGDDHQAHQRWGDLPIREIIARMRHDGCGGGVGRAELVSGIEGVSSRPVRRIVLLAA